MECQCFVVDLRNILQLDLLGLHTISGLLEKLIGGFFRKGMIDVPLESQCRQHCPARCGGKNTDPSAVIVNKCPLTCSENHVPTGQLILADSCVSSDQSPAQIAAEFVLMPTSSRKDDAVEWLRSIVDENWKGSLVIITAEGRRVGHVKDDACLFAERRVAPDMTARQIRFGSRGRGCRGFRDRVSGVLDGRHAVFRVEDDGANPMTASAR